MYSVTVTKHGSERMRKRMGISKKSVDRIAAKAFHMGCRESEARGSLRKFMVRCNEHDGNSCYSVIYGNFVYIFDGNRLVTVYAVPHRIKTA